MATLMGKGNVRAKTITLALNGKWYGQYGRACCPACSGANWRNPSLSVSDGANGALLMWCFKGFAFTEVLRSLKRRGLYADGCTYRSPSQYNMLQHRATLDADAAKRAAMAERCWRESLPIVGTIAETYLKGRGITCTLPETLRFHPACWHASAKRLPAMIAKVDGAKTFAIHRTYLDGCDKAVVAPNKAMLGSVKAGAVRLAHRPGPIIVAEGIETTLSLASGLLKTRGSIWATLSAQGMSALNLPREPGELVIASDGDEVGRAAAFELAGRAASLGWKVATIDPGDGLDFNDILRREVTA